MKRVNQHWPRCWDTKVPHLKTCRELEEKKSVKFLLTEFCWRSSEQKSFFDVLINLIIKIGNALLLSVFQSHQNSFLPSFLLFCILINLPYKNVENVEVHKRHCAPKQGISRSPEWRNAVTTKQIDIKIHNSLKRRNRSVVCFKNSWELLQR